MIQDNNCLSRHSSGPGTAGGQGSALILSTPHTGTQGKFFLILAMLGFEP